MNIKFNGDLYTFVIAFVYWNWTNWFGIQLGQNFRLYIYTYSCINIFKSKVSDRKVYFRCRFFSLFLGVELYFKKKWIQFSMFWSIIDNNPITVLWWKKTICTTLFKILENAKFYTGNICIEGTNHISILYNRYFLYNVWYCYIMSVSVMFKIPIKHLHKKRICIWKI